MKSFAPNLTILPEPQRRLWPELDETPAAFTLYGGTALALRFGHRISVDFDFFSNEGFDPEALAGSVPYLQGAERVQVAPHTLTCRVERGGEILVSFFGGLGLKAVCEKEKPEGRSFAVAALLDLAGTKMDVVQKRAEVKDYLDIDALLQNGMSLTEALSAAEKIYGRQFNPLITLKALSYFGDVAGLPAAARQRIEKAAGRAMQDFGAPL